MPIITSRIDLIVGKPQTKLRQWVSNRNTTLAARRSQQAPTYPMMSHSLQVAWLINLDYKKLAHLLCHGNSTIGYTTPNRPADVGIHPWHDSSGVANNSGTIQHNSRIITSI